MDPLLEESMLYSNLSRVWFVVRCELQELGLCHKKTATQQVGNFETSYISSTLLLMAFVPLTTSNRAVNTMATCTDEHRVATPAVVHQTTGV